MSDSDLLKKGDLIKSRWRITNKIGGGGFGQIYQAYDKLRQELVAVKVESNSQARQSLRMEVTVLRRIQNFQHACELLSGGTSALYNYIVITLLGSSLSELRKNLSQQCFTLSTSLRISLQILDAIESVHSIGFLHRDIKPSNFAIGRQNPRQIFIIDFGLARKYTDSDQHVRPPRAEAGFRGTIRYASINAHKNRELGRHDDLWSFFYMLVEFLIGVLPWSKLKDKESVGRIKETYDYNRFLKYLPNEFDKFLEHIKKLHYETKPDYESLRSLFMISIQRLGYHNDDPYDWEILNEQNQLNPSMKTEPQKQTSEKISHLKQNQSQSLKPTINEQINNDKYHGDMNSQMKGHINNHPSSKLSSRAMYASKISNKSNHDLQLHHSYFALNNPQRNPHEINRIKLNSSSADNQEKSNQIMLLFPIETRSPDIAIQQNTHLNAIEQVQTATNGLLTYVSQQYTNAAAPGTPSLFSQCSRHPGETCIDDDDILKGNKSNNSKADEHLTTFTSEQTSSALQKNTKSLCQKSFIKPAENVFDDELKNSNNNQKYYFSSNDICSIEKNLEVPFGTYVKKYSKTSNNDYSNNHRQQMPPSFHLERLSKNRCDHS